MSSSVLQTEDEFMIEDNGELIIGQDQDCLLGCFDEPQALTGDLEDFTIWDTALTSDEIAQMYIDGYPSIDLEPKITLATDNCEKHGRIHFVSGNYFATLPLHYPVVILRGLPGVPYFLSTVFPVTSVTSPDSFFLGSLGSLVLVIYFVIYNDES